MDRGSPGSVQVRAFSTRFRSWITWIGAWIGYQDQAAVNVAHLK